MFTAKFDKSDIRIGIKSGNGAGEKPILFGTAGHILAVEHQEHAREPRIFIDIIERSILVDSL